MKKTGLILFLCTCLLLSACTSTEQTPASTVCTHADTNNNGLCDTCSYNLMVAIDIFSINDLHGKIADGDNHPGVDELTTYLKHAKATNPNTIFLSAGDMWQGSAESNMTKGQLPTEWMNALDFTAMTLGNHEFDWGEAPVENNSQIAKFPFLAINIYQRDTDTLADYCQPSVIVEFSGVQVGIIGAIGDCYSSISSDKVEDIYFKTGNELTNLVKDESVKLRNAGADFIIYSLHDGYGSSKGASTTEVTSSQLKSYYDTQLSDGYVDLVFEAHTHQRYLLRDEYGIYHVQNSGENKGISRAHIQVNSLTGTAKVTEAKLIASGEYANLNDDPIVEELLTAYGERISPALRVVGFNGAERSGNTTRQLVADLYYNVGIERWGDQYDIALGGGFISVRSPWVLAKGDVTYSMLQSLFPFDNELVLCSVRGDDLIERFIETDNDNYFICRGNISIHPDRTYYIVVDTYTSLYAPNRLTEVDRFGKQIYARDLLADYIEAGNLQ